MKGSILYLAVLFLLAGCFLSTPAYTQVRYGSVVGTVSDPTGAVVPNATVTLTSKDTGVARESKSDEGGRYSFVNVLPGKYDVKVTAPGFRTLAQTDIDVNPSEVARYDAKL